MLPDDTCSANASPNICGLDGAPSIRFFAPDIPTCQNWARAYLSVAVVQDDMQGVIEANMHGVLQTVITRNEVVYKIPVE